ncbi:MAG TPA: hypothetical protein PK857_00505 [Hyphomicrobium sp.]|nr:hypothetical protein [Hyphomicrobium sp.]HRO48779.1 hypothetical protein [Hyphomicrobium sp.]
MTRTDKPALDMSTCSDRLELATQLYERFCADLVERSDMARVRLISGIQIALRDASEGRATPSPKRKDMST